MMRQDLGFGTPEMVAAAAAVGSTSRLGSNPTSSGPRVRLAPSSRAMRLSFKPASGTGNPMIFMSPINLRVHCLPTNSSMGQWFHNLQKTLA